MLPVAHRPLEVRCELADEDTFGMSIQTGDNVLCRECQGSIGGRGAAGTALGLCTCSVEVSTRAELLSAEIWKCKM